MVLAEHENSAGGLRVERRLRPRTAVSISELLHHAVIGLTGQFLTANSTISWMRASGIGDSLLRA